MTLFFKKFFNFEELKEGSIEFSPDNLSEIWTKEDGSLIVAFWWEGSWHTITRGSWASDQALAAPNLLSKRFVCGADRSKTYLFELVGPSNINVMFIIKVKNDERSNANSQFQNL